MGRYLVGNPFDTCLECDIIIVDQATHDRWHAEKHAIEDPNQVSLFG